MGAGVEKLEMFGPALGRPLADALKGSRHPNTKELRLPGTSIRVCFAFDPCRMAILLIGGDKSGQWEAWYRENIHVADALYDEHLAQRYARKERFREQTQELQRATGESPSRSPAPQEG